MKSHAPSKIIFSLAAGILLAMSATTAQAALIRVSGGDGADLKVEFLDTFLVTTTDDASYQGILFMFDIPDVIASGGILNSQGMISTNYDGGDIPIHYITGTGATPIAPDAAAGIAGPDSFALGFISSTGEVAIGSGGGILFTPGTIYFTAPDGEGPYTLTEQNQIYDLSNAQFMAISEGFEPAPVEFIVTTVPEPSGFLLGALGVAGAMLRRRRA